MCYKSMCGMHSERSSSLFSYHILTGWTTGNRLFKEHVRLSLFVLFVMCFIYSCQSSRNWNKTKITRPKWVVDRNNCIPSLRCWRLETNTSKNIDPVAWTVFTLTFRSVRIFSQWRNTCYSYTLGECRFMCHIAYLDCNINSASSWEYFGKYPTI